MSNLAVAAAVGIAAALAGAGPAHAQVSSYRTVAQVDSAIKAKQDEIAYYQGLLQSPDEAQRTSAAATLERLQADLRTLLAIRDNLLAMTMTPRLTEPSSMF